MIKLGEVCDIVRGSSPRPQGDPKYYGGSIPRLMIADVTRDGTYVTPKIDSLTEEGAKKSRPMKKGDVIIAVSGDPGRPCILAVDACIHDGFVGLRNLDETKIHKPYLYCFLSYFKHANKRNAVGAIFQNLTTDQIKKIELPSISLSDQKSISEILSKAESLIAQRKQSINLLDELLKSAFLEMFGDPVRNEKGWKKDNFENLVALDCPLTYGIVQPGEEFTNGIPIIRPVDLTRTYIDRIGLKLIDPKISEKFKRTLLKGNEILMCVRGTTGIVSLASKELAGCNVTRGIVPIWFSKNYSTFFAFGLLKTKAINNEIQNLTYGATLQQINLSDLRKIELINPPIELQTKFANIVEKVEVLKTQYQQSLTELQNMYGVLSQKAFKGELSLVEAKTEKPKFKKCTDINKAILAGHIINSTNNEDFGRVKFQKLLYLTEHVCKLNLGSNYLQNVAGPYDGTLIKEVESTLKRLRFYDIGKSKTGNQINYTPLGAAPQLGKYFIDNFKNEAEVIDGLLRKFKKSTWEQTEIVATLYAVWNNRILKKETITDELLKKDFLEWDPQKKKYKDRLDDALLWMRNKNIVPDGWGKIISK